MQFLNLLVFTLTVTGVVQAVVDGADTASDSSVRLWVIIGTVSIS